MEFEGFDFHRLWCSECSQYRWFLEGINGSLTCLGCRAVGRPGVLVNTTLPIPVSS